MIKKTDMALVFLIGAFLGFVLIDAGHILFNRFWFHNIYFMYIVIGGFVGMTCSVIVNHKLKGENN